MVSESIMAAVIQGHKFLIKAQLNMVQWFNPVFFLSSQEHFKDQIVSVSAKNYGFVTSRLDDYNSLLSGITGKAHLKFCCHDLDSDKETRSHHNNRFSKSFF